MLALQVLDNDVTYFDSFSVERILKEMKISIYKSLFVTNIFRIQAYHLVMWGYFCIDFIDLILAGKTLTNFTNLLSTK